MRVGFISRGRFNEYTGRGNTRCSEKNADILLFGFEGMGEVSYEKELKGESDFFEEVAKLSKREKNIVVCGCVTDMRGHKRKSAIVAENGRLIGISDMLHVIDGNVSSGASLKIYDTQLGKMGVTVAEDLYFPESIRSLALCGCDFILCPFGRVEEIQPVLLRAYAYCYGIPIFFCGIGYCALVDASGKIDFASPYSPIYTEYEWGKEYHVIETRKRGCCRPSI